MLDIRLIRENPDAVRSACQRKRIDLDVDVLLAQDERVRALKTRFDGLRAEQNQKSKDIGRLPPDQRAAASAGVKVLADEVRALEAEVKEAEALLRPLLLQVPNLPSDDVPDGRDDTENVELRREGVLPQFDFEPKDHVQLGLELDLLDTERATRIAGSRTYFLKNDGALLELAVLRFALDHMVAKGFTPMLVPHMVRTEAMEGTAYLPGGEEQAYRTRDDAWLIGTAEVPLTSYRAGEILEEGELPVKLVGLSHCYRREAGTYGRDTHGLYRIHQFQKVEQVVLCRADDAESLRWHQEILGNAESILRGLELPYRVVNVCAGDLGRPQVQKFDIETWMPSRQNYGETHSASRFHDFQSRRLDIRYRSEGDRRPRFVHTLNNTVIASPRILIPLLECHQQKDGSVKIPAALRPYMGGRDTIVPRK